MPAGGNATEGLAGVRNLIFSNNFYNISFWQKTTGFNTSGETSRGKFSASSKLGVSKGVFSPSDAHDYQGEE